MQYLKSYESLLAPEKKIDMNWINLVKLKLDEELSVLIKDYTSEIIREENLIVGNIYDLVDINIKSGLIKVRFTLSDINSHKNVKDKKINLFAKTEFKISVLIRKGFGRITRLPEYKLHTQSSVFKSNEDVDINSIVDTVKNAIDIDKKKRVSISKSSEFFSKLNKEDIRDLFFELSDIVGEYTLTKTSHTTGSYLLRFTSDKSVIKFNHRKNLIEPNSEYYQVVSELNNINERLKHFNAFLQFSIDNDGPETLVIVVFNSDI
jgi:hypothetical protein